MIIIIFSFLNWETLSKFILVDFSNRKSFNAFDEEEVVSFAPQQTHMCLLWRGCYAAVVVVVVVVLSLLIGRSTTVSNFPQKNLLK